jgi:hypothetical protein
MTLPTVHAAKRILIGRRESVGLVTDSAGCVACRVLKRMILSLLWLVPPATPGTRAREYRYRICRFTALLPSSIGVTFAPCLSRR